MSIFLNCPKCGKKSQLVKDLPNYTMHVYDVFEEDGLTEEIYIDHVFMYKCKNSECYCDFYVSSEEKV